MGQRAATGVGSTITDRTGADLKTAAAAASVEAVLLDDIAQRQNLLAAINASLATAVALIVASALPSWLVGGWIAAMLAGPGGPRDRLGADPWCCGQRNRGLIASLEASRQLLEQRVRERLLELSRANAALTREVEERRRSEAQLRYRLQHDGLTQVANRTLFQDRLAADLARAQREAGRLAVVMIDLVGFEAINDRLGHHAGDRVLVEVAARLRRESRASDTVARLRWRRVRGAARPARRGRGRGRGRCQSAAETCPRARPADGRRGRGDRGAARCSREIGCDEAQGYLLDRPMPGEALRRLMT